MQAYGYFLQMLKLCLSTLVDGLEIPQHTQPSTYQPIQVRNKIKSNICIEVYVALSPNTHS